MGLENRFGLPFFSRYTPIQLLCELSGQLVYTFNKHTVTMH